MCWCLGVCFTAVEISGWYMNTWIWLYERRGEMWWRRTRTRRKGRKTKRKKKSFWFFTTTFIHKRNCACLCFHIKHKNRSKRIMLSVLMHLKKNLQLGKEYFVAPDFGKAVKIKLQYFGATLLEDLSRLNSHLSSPIITFWSFHIILW